MMSQKTYVIGDTYLYKPKANSTEVEVTLYQMRQTLKDGIMYSFKKPCGTSLHLFSTEVDKMISGNANHKLYEFEGNVQTTFSVKINLLSSTNLFTARQRVREILQDNLTIQYKDNQKIEGLQINIEIKE